ncbi:MULTISPECIES: hypothetical protein [Enterobacter]|uniref:hypothetical protein n=1 Tax=Enterobacter TaxID=547 RepID=UPI000489BEE8|nr:MULTISPECIES: hypothetical protein [Enterobacter cloacae complex]HDT2077579.1 hypothetical protein [Enterobacter roggenkampii]HEG2003796.1 hypothetical protein [Enterobacter asburiae]HEL9845224.1 hypothetical protein [Klebsiella pneumoniae]MCD2461383.1 hypothetical protein [Enterobacter cloacae complex sp. 2021EL-01261]MDT9877568.1 hypothetical protein [Enterobacter cloacae]
MAWYEITGTLADWVMAGAAAYAAFNAKQWFSQRSHTKGFDKAEEILSITDNLYDSTYKTIEDLYPVLNYLNELNSGLKKPDIKKAQEFELSENKHIEFISKIDNLIKELDLIERWSIKVENKEVILAVTKSLREVNESACNAYISAQSSILECVNNNQRGFELSRKSFNQHYKEYLESLAASESAYNLFKKQKFITFFKVK